MGEVKNRIREVRTQKKISGTKMAKKLGISPQYYYDIEKGERNLSADLAADIASNLDVSVDFLLMREQPAEYYVQEPGRVQRFDELDINVEVLEKLKLVTDDEGYFFEDVKLEGFMAVAKNLDMSVAYHNSNDHHFYANQTVEYFDNPDDYTEYQQKEIINELNEAYNYKTIKTALRTNDIEAKQDFLNEINKIILQHDLEKKETPYSNEKEFVDKLELTDDKLLEQFNLQLDGKPLSKNEAKGVIAYLRSLRQFDK